jgi:hypothetical protein
MPYQFLADAVLTLHFGIVLFVVGGLLLVLVGNVLSWPWVNTWWFRLTHIAAIVFIIVQTWLGQLCPLTTLESWLRIQAGSRPYTKSFIEHWLQQLIFYEAPVSLVYTVFGALVVLAWWLFPPSRGAR